MSKAVEDIPWKDGDERRFTAELVKAVQSGQCQVIRGFDFFRTNRPANAGHPKSTGTHLNFESELTHPFDFMAVARAAHMEQPRVALDSIRLFGSVDDTASLHYHGYSKSKGGEIGHGQFVIFSIKSISPYDAKTGNIDHRHMARNNHLLDANAKQRIIGSENDSPLVMMTVKDGVVKKLNLRVGDVVVLPGGAYHEFSCKDGIYADLSYVEIGHQISAMGHTSFPEQGEYDSIIGKTIQAETGAAPSKSKGPRLADIPSLKAFLETARPRHDAAILSGR